MTEKKNVVYVGADHGGYALKVLFLEELPQAFPGWVFEDLGCDSQDSVNYPDYAEKVARKVVENNALGILLCGSGIGVSIAANKINGIRASLVWDVTSAHLSREHNNANILCMGARLVGRDVALESARTWLNTEFHGGRHQKRVDLIHQLEQS